MASGRPRTLCIDIGGTGHQDARRRPGGQAPDRAAARRHAAAGDAEGRDQGDPRRWRNSRARFDRVSVGFPGVVRRGVAETAPNLHPAWIGVDLDRLLTKELGKPVRAANDADVQGLGAVKGEGVELVITLGTGFGSSLFVDGRLVPNMQLAHHAGWRRQDLRGGARQRGPEEGRQEEMEQARL